MVDNGRMDWAREVYKIEMNPQNETGMKRSNTNILVLTYELMVMH